jgi:hypothetical protein
LVLIAFGVAALAAIVLGVRRGVTRVVVLYAIFFWVAFWLGPKSLGGPFQVYLVYARYAGLALLFTLLIANVVASRAVFIATCAGVLALGVLCAIPVREFSTLVADYDDVRAAIPPRSTVLSIYQPNASDPLVAHHPAGALHFLHMVDGAAYVGFLFNNSAHPVFHRSDVKLPRPQIGFAKDWDYVVVRGARPSAAMDNMPDFSLLEEAGGWRIYKNDR